jgi:murein DD-endopeptidase MepM/ murein hydrolase activator NlpD
VRATPSSLRQGDSGALIVTGVPDAKLIEGSVGDRPLIFFPYADGYAALIGVDLAAPTGSATWRVGWVDGAGNPRKAVGAIKIKPRKFPVQKLSLPGNLVDLDRATEQRAEREAAQLNTLYGMSSGERLWRGHFTRPVASNGPGEGFGARRIINGKPRSPHSGLDYAAPTGTPVVAANRGRVALIGDFFFGGRTVALDHGQGLYTLYMHLDRVQVVEGSVVERGETIGAVGSTGRATGPHLHWGAQLRRARVDPVGLLALPVRD